MSFETTSFILFVIAFILLAYNIIVFIQRREYENKRIFTGYNTLIFGFILLTLSILIKTIKFGFLTFNGSIIEDYLLHFDIATNLVLIPLFVISYLVAIFAFKEA